MRNNINIFSYRRCIVCNVYLCPCKRDVDISFYCAMLCRLYCRYNIVRVSYGWSVCVGTLWQKHGNTRIGRRRKKEKCLLLNIKIFLHFSKILCNSWKSRKTFGKHDKIIRNVKTNQNWSKCDMLRPITWCKCPTLSLNDVQIIS